MNPTFSPSLPSCSPPIAFFRDLAPNTASSDTQFRTNMFYPANGRMHVSHLPPTYPSSPDTSKSDSPERPCARPVSHTSHHSSNRWSNFDRDPVMSYYSRPTTPILASYSHHDLGRLPCSISYHLRTPSTIHTLSHHP